MLAQLGAWRVLARLSLLSVALLGVAAVVPVAHASFTYSATSATVTDSIYLLEWDACVDGQANGTCSGAPSAFTWQQALQRVAAMNASNHKGHNDWRLPNKNELESLVDLSLNNPAIDPAFPNAPSASFWSSTVNAKNLGQAWKVNFNDGSVFVDAHGTAANIRVVRSGSANDSTDRFALPVAPSPLDVLLANITVYDTRTLLQWDRCPWGVTGADCTDGAPVAQTWQQALQLPALANAANHKGFSDWRLPNKNELESIVDLSVLPPTVEAAAFPNTPSTAFFSSTLNYKDLGQAWKVSFGDGSVFVDSHGTAANIRLVRGGGPSGSTDRFALPITPSPLDVVAANATVYDSRTLLQWDRCPWGVTGASCADGAPVAQTWQQALQLPALANAANHKGFSDWRLPNKNELESIVDLNVLPPTLEAIAFPNTPSAAFFSSTVNYKNLGQAWKVSFGDGSVFVDAHGTAANVRLVRGGGTSGSTDRFNLAMPPSPYTAASGTVNDARTGLVWDACSFGKTGNDCTGASFQVSSWQDALLTSTAANSTNYKGFNDWRIPNKNELESLVDLGRLAPVIDTTVFPDTQSQAYWSSTVNAKSAGQAWAVSFGDGSVSVQAHAMGANLRLVRGGGSFDGQVPPLNGACGAADGVATSSAPTLNLCAAGSVSQFAGTGPWTWTCLGANGGTPASCGAPVLDSTPPVLSSVSATATTLTATSNEAATGYWIALAHGAPVPTVVQVQAFAIYGTAGVLARGTGAMTAGVAKTFAVTGLNANTVYDFYIVAEDASQNISARGSAQNAIDAACASSTVATVQLVDISNKMTENYALAFGRGALRSTFNITCANGRFGVVRLPKVESGVVAGNAYALVQSSCATKAVRRDTVPVVTSPVVAAAWANRLDQSALLADAMFGPLARWVCE